MENEADVSSFKDYHPSSEGDVLSISDESSKSMSTSEGPLPVTPPTSTQHQTPQVYRSTESVPVHVSSSSPPTDRILASPYARKLATEKGLDLKVNPV